MKAKLVKVAKFAVYPLFYLFCLGLFGYLTFPFNRLKDRLLQELSYLQTKKNSGIPLVEIDDLDGYWFTGLSIKGARVFVPPSDASPLPRKGFDFGAKDPSSEASKPSVVVVDEAHARLRILPLFLGRVRIDFWASALGGEVEGVVPVGKSSGPVQVEVAGVKLEQAKPIEDMLGGIPIRGNLNAKLELEAVGGKFNKANGSLELTISELYVGDKDKKIAGLIALPVAHVGDLELSAEAKDGVLKVNKLTANGKDLELIGDGKINVRQPWNNSSADLYVRFKFTDAYRSKDDLTKSLLGDPNSSLPALIEVQLPKLKRAKRSDGFYGWRVHGQLKRLKFDPHASDAPATRSRTKSTDSPFGAPTTTSRKSSLDMLGLPSPASKPADAEAEPPPPPPAVPDEPPAPPPEPPKPETQPPPVAEQPPSTPEPEPPTVAPNTDESQPVEQ